MKQRFRRKETEEEGEDAEGVQLVPVEEECGETYLRYLCMWGLLPLRHCVCKHN